MSAALDQLIDEAAATCERINAICGRAESVIAALQQSMPVAVEDAPPVPEKLAGELCGFRYFTDGQLVWKMPPTGKGLCRDANRSRWDLSARDLSDFSHYLEKEITAEEGESK